MAQNEWIESYLKWLREQYKVSRLPLGTEITTPFTNSIGDNIRIYLEASSSSNIRLSDDGNTFNDLEMMGIDLSIKTRQELASRVFSQYGTAVTSDGVIFIEGSSNKFPILKQNLVQTILRIDDLTQTRKPVIKNILQQEVADYFESSEIAAVSNYPLDGASGNPYKFDFAIGQTKSKPLRLIQAIPRLTFERVAAESVTYADVRKTLPPNRVLYILIFDDQSNPVPTKASTIASQYGTEIVPWSDKEALETLL